jgi:tetraacyldisaccharide 4'-kinase
MHILRLLLWPFSLLYGLVITVRNFLYDKRLLKSKRFDLPVIVIGNLAIGGTGKSPLTEYLLRLLKGSFKVASLSRGYGRKTTGFLYVNSNDSYTRVGDEPLQFKTKYPDITVAVCEDRVEGVKILKESHDIIVLDDAFQHRALTPGLSILLFDYESLFKPLILLPAGNLRDSFSQRKRADMIIITKVPVSLSEEMRTIVMKKMALKEGQRVLFSSLNYGNPYNAFNTEEVNCEVLHPESTILLVTGIANPKPLINYIENKCQEVKVLSYPDHHSYTEKDIRNIIQTYTSLSAKKKFIVSTEKDLQRLRQWNQKSTLLSNLPIWIIPVETCFNEKYTQQFHSIILDYCNKQTTRDRDIIQK